MGQGVGYAGLCCCGCSATTPASKYGLKWWLFPYGDGMSRLAWAGSGFGGQMPIILPDYDLVMVFTGWNILPDKPRRTVFSQRVAIDRVLHAITDRPQ